MVQGIQETKPPQRIRRADNGRRRALLSSIIGLRLCHSRGARWYSYGGRYISDIKAFY